MALASKFAVLSRMRYAVEIVRLGRVLEHISCIVWRGGVVHGNNVGSHGGGSQGGRSRVNSRAGPGESPGWRAVCDSGRTRERRIRPGAYCPGPVAAARTTGISHQ